jgi:cysteine-rich repeat protein
MRRAITAVIGLMLVGCVVSVRTSGGSEPADDEPVPAPVAITIDGRPVGCGAMALVGDEARVGIVAAPEDGTPALTLDRAAVSLEREPARWRAVVRAPEGRSELVVAVERGRCEVVLVRSRTLRDALASLEGASRTRPTVMYDHETGAPANVVLDVAGTGETPGERARQFLAAYAPAFGTTVDQLRPAGEQESADGWTSVRFDQVIGGVPAWSASLTVVIGASGRVRSVHSSVIPALREAPPATLESDAVRALAEGQDLGAIREVGLTVHDRVRPRAGWIVRGERAVVLVDDASGEVVDERELTFGVAPVEVYVGTPTERTLVRSGVGGAATVVDPAADDPLTGLVYDSLSDISAYTQARFGETGWSALGDGTVRAVVSDAPNARFHGWLGTIEVGRGLAAAPDVLCHEYAHGIHVARQGDMAASIYEALADTFAMECGPAIDATDAPFVIGDAVGGVRNPGEGTSADGAAVTHLDGISARTRNPYARSFLHTHAVALAVQRYGMRFSLVPELTWEALGWRGLDTYPQLRDRWLATLTSWADSGRFGATAADVCAMAQGYREVGLDGEYAEGTGCQGEAPEGVDLVCTRRYCPLCPDEPVVSDALCPPSSFVDRPFCTNEHGERVCVGAIASFQDDCGTGMVRTCTCVEDGLTGYGAVWSCNRETQRCRPRYEGGYCPGEPLTCGNGVLDRGETCDDGNVYEGDGCSFECQAETTCDARNYELGHIHEPIWRECTASHPELSDPGLTDAMGIGVSRESFCRGIGAVSGFLGSAGGYVACQTPGQAAGSLVPIGGNIAAFLASNPACVPVAVGAGALSWLAGYNFCKSVFGLSFGRTLAWTAEDYRPYTETDEAAAELAAANVCSPEDYGFIRYQLHDPAGACQDASCAGPPGGRRGVDEAYCRSLIERTLKADRCLHFRQEQDRCFAGNTDDGHLARIREARNAVRNCAELVVDYCERLDGFRVPSWVYGL